MCQEPGARCTNALHATTVYVTHDQMEAMAMADTIAIMNQGVIEQLGAPQEVYERPASVFVADFIGAPAMNLPARAGAARSEHRVGHDRRRDRCRVPALNEDAPGDSSAAWRAPRTRYTSRPSRGCAPRVLGTEYLRHQPDRHLPNRTRRDLACEGRRAHCGCSAAIRSGSNSIRHSSRCSIRCRAARCRPHATPARSPRRPGRHGLGAPARQGAAHG